MTLWGHARSAASFAVITANLAFWLVLVIALSLLRLLLPGFRPTALRLLEAIYRAAVHVDDFWLRRVVGLHWSLPALPLDPRRSVLVVSNHVAWSDVFLIQSLLVRHGLVVKFLTKRELLALPIVGLILWAFEFPILRRTRRGGRGGGADRDRERDFEALREACRSARENPVALVSFAEGTRATAVRRASRATPYRHLLPPRVGGFGALCDGLGEALAGIVDCTLVYSRANERSKSHSAAAAGPARPTRDVTFWEFLSGESIEVVIQAEWIDPGELPAQREERAHWLAERWAIKDERIDRLRQGTHRRDASRSRF